MLPAREQFQPGPQREMISSPFLAPDDHGEDAGRIFLLIFLALAGFGGARVVAGDEVGECGVVEDAGGGVADIQEYLVESAMGEVAVDEFAELFGVTEWGQWAVDQADDLAEVDVRRLAAELVAALGAAHAFHHAGILEFEEDEFQEFFREHLFVGDVSNLDGALVVMAGQHHHGLKSVETFLRDFHNAFRMSI